MNDRQRAVKILEARGEPIEPNEWTDSLIKDIVKEIRFRRKHKADKEYVKQMIRFAKIVGVRYAR